MQFFIMIHYQNHIKASTLVLIPKNPNIILFVLQTLAISFIISLIFSKNKNLYKVILCTLNDSIKREDSTLLIPETGEIEGNAQT